MKFGRLGVLLVLLTQHVAADSNGTIEIDAWARATPPGGTSGAIYGTFRNTGSPAAVADAVRFEAAGHVMVHQTVEADGMARMRHASLAIGPGDTLVMAPGGTHIMLMGLSAPLVEGCRYEFEIEWTDGMVTRHDFVVGGFGQRQAPTESVLKKGEVCQ